MKIIFLSHPTFLNSESMLRFANMQAEGMKKRGHDVELWKPTPRVYKLPAFSSLKKWFGYVDQYIIFPLEIKQRSKGLPADTLFVFTDHALGPWVPLLAHRRHVIHCHDFLPVRSALGEVPQNKTPWLGRRYQAFIRRGFQRGKYFVSDSEKTKNDLHRFAKPQLSKVVYIGLNQSFQPSDPIAAREQVGKASGLSLGDGYILHVGGNHWYKNRVGVIQVYNAWRKRNEDALPLVMIGQPADEKLKAAHESSPYKKEIHLLRGINDDTLLKAYAGATVFLFPSLEEGFGWPIAEAMASGVPVITTGEAPMTEVAGDAAFLIARKPDDETKAEAWADESAKTLSLVLHLTPAHRKGVIEAGYKNAKRFNTEVTIINFEAIYEQIPYAGQTVNREVFIAKEKPVISKQPQGSL